MVDRQDGTRRLYQVDPDGLALLRAHLNRFWERSLAAFEDRARAEQATAAPVDTPDEKGVHRDRDR